MIMVAGGQSHYYVILTMLHIPTPADHKHYYRSLITTGYRHCATNSPQLRAKIFVRKLQVSVQLQSEQKYGWTVMVSTTDL